MSSGITMTNSNIYWAAFDRGVNIKFYINDVLVATHTTNLPTTGNPMVIFGIQTAAAAGKKMDIKNNYIIKSKI